MRERLLSHWRGLALTLVCVAATLWLAATGQLDLYIHPDYEPFAVTMAVLAGLAAVGAAAVLPTADARDEAHDHGHERAPRELGFDAAYEETPASRGPRRVGAVVASGALLVATTGALIVLPPATLSSATAAKRQINASASVDVDALVAGDGSSFSVKEWAALLSQGTDQAFLLGASPDVTGFVVPHPDAPDDVFYVTRFVISHCAIDAQPVGVPVYLPGWQDRLATDDWVHVTGSFVTDAGATGGEPIVLEPGEVAEVEEPADPYVY